MQYRRQYDNCTYPKSWMAVTFRRYYPRSLLCVLNRCAAGSAIMSENNILLSPFRRSFHSLLAPISRVYRCFMILSGGSEAASRGPSLANGPEIVRRSFQQSLDTKKALQVSLEGFVRFYFVTRPT